MIESDHVTSSTLYTALAQQWDTLRVESLANIDRFRSRSLELVVVNAHAACTNAFLRAETEWRLGEGNPAPFLMNCISDCRLLLSVRNACPVREDEEIAYRIASFNAIFSQLLLGETVDESFRVAIRQPRRFGPTHKQDGFDGSEWDNVVLELIETGQIPAQFDALYSWMDSRKKRFGLKNHCDTMQAYRRLLEAALAHDATAAEQAIGDADKLFTQRRNGDVTWGGGDVSDRTVDVRLAGAIKTAEHMSPGITLGAATPHRWRW